jgi:DNA repair exonuclease SbcCD ATPase subunit
MIIFHNITYRNILSVGQAPITIGLDDNRLTALHGPSGSGKSLFLDALSFVLFGRAFRDINKSALINTLNAKGLLVEVEFSAGADRYRVCRGMKPNVFEISINGSPLNQDSHTKDQQKFLESQILKMNWRMFAHVVLLGAANYTPFLRLKPSDRKKLVENIVGIDVFSTMNAVLKTKMSDETLVYKGATQRRESLLQQTQYLEEQQKAFKLKRESEVKALTDKLRALRDKKKTLDLSITEKEHEIEIDIQSFDPKVEIPEFVEVFDESFDETFLEVFDEVFSDVFAVRDPSDFDTSSYVKEIATKAAEGKALKEKIAHLDKHSAFYADNDSCPTCSQKIDEEFRKKSVEDLATERGRLQEDFDRLLGEAKKLNVVVEGVKKQHEEYKASYSAFVELEKAFARRKADFEGRQRAFEGRRRAFEERQRAFEKRKAAHTEKLANANHEIEAKRTAFQKGVDAKKASLSSLKDQLTTLLAEAKFTKEALDAKKVDNSLDNSGELLRLLDETAVCVAELDSSAQTLRLWREAQAIIRDDGVKAELLKRYIPVLNRYINDYLTKMGMFVSFELDAELNDKICSRHRDELSYSNYSEGERQRIDLAVLFAWRHLAQAQASVSTNLMVLDEVLDSFLDQGTTELILGLMKEEAFHAYNIFVISHKEGLSEHFNKTLSFAKKSNFTTVS